MNLRHNIQSATVCDNNGIGAVVGNCVSQCSAVPIDFQASPVGTFGCPGLQEDNAGLGCRVDRGQCTSSDDLSVVKNILHESIVLLSAALDSVQRCDNICQPPSTRAATRSKHAVFVVVAGQKSVCQVTSIVTEDTDVLRSLQRQSVVLILEQDDTCRSKLTDQFLVVAADIDVGFGVVGEVVEV